jgi:hypothetical protein
MNAPLIGMSFGSFVVLLIVSLIAAAIVHWAFRYRLFQASTGLSDNGWWPGWVRGWALQCWVTGSTGPCWRAFISSRRLPERLPVPSVEQ